MKIELAKKLKEQRKTKRLTIAEILSRSNVVPVFNPQNVRCSEPTNPNEPDDKPPINIEIQPMAANPAQNQVESMSSSNHWGSSSSSSQDEEELKSNQSP